VTCFVSRRRSPVKEMWIGRVKYFGIICVAGVAGVGSCGCGKLVVGRRYGMVSRVLRCLRVCWQFFPKSRRSSPAKKAVSLLEKKANL